MKAQVWRVMCSMAIGGVFVAGCVMNETLDIGEPWDEFHGHDAGWTDGDGDVDGDGDGDSDIDADGDGDSDVDDGRDPLDPEDPSFDDEPIEEEPEEPTCDIENEVVLYLSADDSNSMAGPAVARGIINQGQIVYKALRTYEFLNYYGFDYEPPAGDGVALHLAMREDEEGTYNLQIGVQAPVVDADERRDVNLTIAVDTSSSMGWGATDETGIDRARTACGAVAGALREGDVVSLVTWGGNLRTALAGHTVQGPDDPALLAECAALRAYGTTNFHEGLSAAYERARDAFDSSKINRVVLISDGGANVGATDEELISEQADDADGEAIYLLGIGVGDPWNYNDVLMNAVTDAGKGAYIFLDSQAEAEHALRDGFLRHVEIAARNVQVELTLPPSFQMVEFHGEEYSTNPEEVEPQHLAMNDAMVFHQIVSSCAPEVLSGDSPISVRATFLDPLTREPQEVSVSATFGELLAIDDPLLRKGDAVVAYAEALKSIRLLNGDAALQVIDETLVPMNAARDLLPGDADLQEIADLLMTYRSTLMAGQTEAYPPGGSGVDPEPSECSRCDGVGVALDNMRCAAELCDSDVFLDQWYTSPTSTPVESTYTATAHFGDETNDLEPRVGSSYALMATGPAVGSSHSSDLGGISLEDPFSKFGADMFNAVEWRLRLKAPAGANGFRIHHIFFSEEYDEFVGSTFNDKFYIIVEAGSTNSGESTVINYADCRDPQTYHDFVCSPGMQYCNPRQPYCYIAINTAASECCWLDGCPDGTATTDISGTGFSCSNSTSDDSASRGSSTGWMVTEWPIEPGETFELVFHLHDTGDGIYDSAAIIDGIEFLDAVTPGTWSI